MVSLFSSFYYCTKIEFATISLSGGSYIRGFVLSYLDS
jgi:hypothetical protein